MSTPRSHERLAELWEQYLKAGIPRDRSDEEIEDAWVRLITIDEWVAGTVSAVLDGYAIPGRRIEPRDELLLRDIESLASRKPEAEPLLVWTRRLWELLEAAGVTPD